MVAGDCRGLDIKYCTIYLPALSSLQYLHLMYSNIWMREDISLIWLSMQRKSDWCLGFWAEGHQVYSSNVQLVCWARSKSLTHSLDFFLPGEEGSSPDLGNITCIDRTLTSLLHLLLLQLVITPKLTRNINMVYILHCTCTSFLQIKDCWEIFHSLKVHSFDMKTRLMWFMLSPILVGHHDTAQGRTKAKVVMFAV